MYYIDEGEVSVGCIDQDESEVKIKKKNSITVITSGEMLVAQMSRRMC